MMKALTLLAVLATAVLLGAQTSKSPVTELSADLGTCSADFHVTDLAGAPLYDAKVKTTIRYGIMSKRKLDLEAGTNADGRARFVKLPNELKRPMQFTVTYQNQTASFSIDPATDCTAQREVPLRASKYL